MLGLDKDHHALGLQLLHKGVGDLGGEPLLQLEPLGEHLHRPGHLAQTHHFPVGDIGDGRRAIEGQHVVLAEGIEVDVLLHDHVVVVHVEALFQVLGRVVGIAPGQLLIHPGDAVRGLQQALAIDVLADPAEDQANALFDLLRIHDVRLLFNSKRQRPRPGRTESRR